VGAGTAAGQARDILRAMATLESGDERPTIAPLVGPDDPRRFTDSGIEVETVYLRPQRETELEPPGEFPYTRGIRPESYRTRLWTMRQYAGYASATESNARYRYLLEHGSTGLSMAFDLPTQLGLDSDDPRSLGEVGRTGVAIDTIDDMRTAFDGIPLDSVSTSMTINAPAAVLLCLYELVAQEQGVPAAKLRGTSQNDILKEYIARGNYIYPPGPSLRLTTDLFAYCHERMPLWNTISISGYHFREKGSSAVQEVAFTLANGITYVQAAIAAGLAVDSFAPRLAFFFGAHNNVFQEIAKFRAARRMWAQIMRERFGAREAASTMLRFHTQTAGVTLTAQQPYNNIVRVALQAFSAVCGGTQSLHTNGYDEALALPSEHAANLALRTQQVIAHESGAADSADPFAGSYLIESLTDEIERRAGALIAKVDALGGSLQAIGFITNEIDESAWSYQERYRTGQDVVVGVNRYVEDGETRIEGTLQVDPASERDQRERLAAFKANRDAETVHARLAELAAHARAATNLLVPIGAALRDRCTLGEVCGTLREVFGSYQPH
jgi:methylmalonyl-CoA mutase N-terminal domain/subunit